MRRWKRLRRHVRILIAAAVSLWLAMFSLAGAEAFGVGADLPRSMAQGAAVTLSIAAFVFATRGRDGRTVTPGGAAWATEPTVNSTQITIELPRVKMPQPRAAELADMPPVLMAQIFRMGAADAREGRHRP